MFIESHKKIWDRWGWGALIVIAGLLSYSNCFQGEFVFDDNGGILGNAHIQHLWPLSSAMSAPTRTSIIGRPTICLSLALNYAINGLNVWGYRAANLGIHLISGLLLFGLIRRTLTNNEKLRAWAGGQASVLAFAAALLWTLHPLNTQVVNYIIQRCESLMAMFYLLTLYAAMRSMEDRANQKMWQIVAIAACALGMGSKEVMVSAPLIVLLYDRFFISGSFSNALKRGKFVYAGLALTWGILALMVAMGGQINSARLDRPSWTKYEYALTQSEVIVYYLRLAFYPQPLCFDYAWPAANSIIQVLPFLLIMFALIGATAWALRFRPELGFLGAWFFVLLAPSSSIMPLPDMAVEYRIYTALMAVSILVVVAVLAAIRKMGRTILAEKRKRRRFRTHRVDVRIVDLCSKRGLSQRHYFVA